MRLHRLSLRNFRGITEREIEFTDTGVTVIEGPNEAGKSSMIEALDLLLEVSSDSRAARVREVMPSGLDVGTDIEAEITCGDTRFTYAKRFNRRHSTTLTIHTPRAEQLAGRDAHNRVRQILAETVDLALFKALKLLQSNGPEAAGLNDSAALSAALDRAVGAESSDAEHSDTETSDFAAGDSALIDAVTAEYRRYFTLGQGKPTGEYASAQAAATSAGDRYEELRRGRALIEEDATRLQEAARQRADTEHALELTKVEYAEIEEQWQAVEAAQSRWEQARREVDLRRSAVSLGERELAERTDLDVRLTAAVAARDTRRSSAEEHRLRADEAEADATALEAELAAVRTRLTEVRAALQTAKLRERIAHGRAELDRINGVIDRIEQIDTECEALRTRLRTMTIDAHAAATAERLRRELAVVEGRLESASSMITVTPLGDTKVRVDGQDVLQEKEFLASRDRLIEIDGVLRVAVRRPADTEDLASTLERLQAEREDFCAEHGLDSLSEAPAALEARNEVAVAGRELEARRVDLLGGADLADLRARRERVHAGLCELEASVASAPPIDRGTDAIGPEELTGPEEPTDPEELADTERSLADLVSAAERTAAEKRAQAAGHRTRASLAAEQCAASDEEIATLTARLTALREAKTDDQVRSQKDDAVQALAAAEATEQDAGAAVAALDVAEIERRRDQAAAELRAGQARVGQLDSTITELRTRIDVYREESRLDDLDDATIAWETANADLRRIQRRAEAAAALYRVLTAKRDESRTRYVDPFTRRLEELGESVFGASVRFEVDSDLRVLSRTVDGVTVGHDGLSGGAKEQLGLLARLACATLVDTADGVPVIIDDALGYSDPERVEAMAEVLARAGEQAQVIVLTCTPERYDSVQGAHRIAI